MTEGTGGKERNPWMYTTFVLAIVAVGLMVTNVQTTGYILAGNTGGTPITGQAINNQPTQQPTNQPTNNPPAQQPSAVQVSTDNDAVVGNANAPITIIEFSDFQCPFCGRFYDQTLPQIYQNYIDTGKAKLVFRDFPLSFHPEAQPAAEAAECAKEQDKFWEMHDKIFENQDAMNTAAYKQWAAELGLNTQQFNSCLDTGKYRSEVQDDFNDGAAAGVSGTPTFFIGNDQSGYQKIVGAQPYGAFQAILDQQAA